MSSISILAEFEQLVPWHSEHAVEHGKLLFRHVHFLVSQFALQEHLITSKSLAGAGGSDVVTGNSFPFLFTHPQSSAL